MAVTLGRDYAIARKTTWWFPDGIGAATAVLTRRAIYLFPHKLLARTTATSRTNVVFSIDGRLPLDAIAALVARPDATPEMLDGQLTAWATQVGGPIREELAAFPRIRVFDGWLRRGVALSRQAAGYDVRPLSMRPAKDEIGAFVALLGDRPGVELK